MDRSRASWPRYTFRGPGCGSSKDLGFKPPKPLSSQHKLEVQALDSKPQKSKPKSRIETLNAEPWVLNLEGMGQALRRLYAGDASASQALEVDCISVNLLVSTEGFLFFEVPLRMLTRTP